MFCASYVYFLYIFIIDRGQTALRGLLFPTAEHQPEDGTGQRAAVQHLPAQRHGHIAAPCVPFTNDPELLGNFPALPQTLALHKNKVHSLCGLPIDKTCIFLYN